MLSVINHSIHSGWWLSHYSLSLSSHYQINMVQAHSATGTCYNVTSVKCSQYQKVLEKKCHHQSAERWDGRHCCDEVCYSVSPRWLTLTIRRINLQTEIFSFNCRFFHIHYNNRNITALRQNSADCNKQKTWYARLTQNGSLQKTTFISGALREQESLAKAKVSARQQCTYEGP